MTIPAFDVFLQPTLAIVAERGTIDSARQAIIVPMAERLGLKPEDFEERLESGGSRLASRCGWALTYLKKAGLLTSFKKGQVSITEEGHQFLQAHPKFGKTDLETIPSFAEFAHGNLGGEALGTLTDEGGSTEVLPPDERILASLAQIREGLIEELLGNLHNCSPAFFEKLTLQLVQKLGYGKNENSLKHTGRNGDFGIDGIVSQDTLGFEKIFLQAKRWQGTVGQGVLRDFCGALEFQRANKGVLITTSTFSADAQTYAERTEKKLVLIDGRRLCELMIDYQVGVQHEVLKLTKLDRDYFEGAELSQHGLSLLTEVGTPTAPDWSDKQEMDETAGLLVEQKGIESLSALPSRSIKARLFRPHGH